MQYVLIFIIIILIVEKIINKKDNTVNIKTEDIKNKQDYSLLYSKKEYLLTQQELKFYKLLKMIIDKNNLNLFSQVALYQIVRNKEIKDFNKIKSKTIDFIITDINCKIKICIELDDITHLKENRQERDEFIDELFKQLDIKLIRIPVQNYYNMNDIEQKIKESL